MDERFNQTPVFQRRRLEWDKEKVKAHIERLFRSVEIIEGWEFISCEWGTGQKTKRSEELKRHILSVLKIKVKDTNEKEYTYDVQVPELIEDQFFYIGGYLKIPIFQLFDHPIIHRKGVVRLRTNTLTATLDLNRNDAAYKLKIFNKDVPIDFLITAAYEKEDLDTFMETRTDECPALSIIVERCERRWEETTQEERVNELGKFFSTMNTDKTKKGLSAIFSLKAAYAVDFFSHEFFETDSILFEILNAIYSGTKSDTDFSNKRIRFEEYILAPLTKKIYDMLLTIFNSKKVKFQITQSIITDNCNVSDIVHFNFPINPVGEVASLLQATLTGPGGFKKDNVPSHLRDLDDSQFGYVCPADTPDRDGCGVILNMVPTVDIEENGDFGDQSKEVVTSYPISLSPFLEHNDQVRLQMVSNNLKQSILLKESENPLIRSGVEDAYLEESTFMYKAKDNGKVEYLDSKFMIVSYENGETDIIRISFRNLYLNSIDYLVPDFREGDEFKRGDIMCHSIMTKNGELALGQNLHTGIAIWKGYNYEDGIVIRESATKKFVSMHSVDLTYAIEPGQVLLSLLDDKYSPFPKIGQDLKKGDVYAKIKTLDGEDGFESINIEPFEFAAPCNCRITDIEIYPNSWNKKVDEFNKAVHTLTTKQTDNFVSLQQRLSSFMPQDDVEKFITLHGLSRLDCSSRKGKYTYKGQKIGGIIIKIQAVYEEQIGIGDKMANRHGNKGVIAKVVPDDIMPTTADGRKLDIIINPLGIISRMNVGQLYELHTNEAMYRLKAKLRALKTDKKKLAVLKGFLDIVDKSSTKWVTDKIMDVYEKALKDDPESAEDKLYLIQPPFESIKAGSLFEAMEYAGATFKSKVTDNSNNLELENPIATGYVHFLKLVHRSSDKMSARSIGPYSKKTLQPLGGKSKQGGHRLGEMETWALQAHGAQNLLEDFLTVQSDSSGLKNQFLAEVLHNPDLNVTKTDPRPQSLKLLDSYLMVMGLGIDNKGNIIEAVEAEELEDSLPDIVLGGDSEEEVADE